MKKLLLITLIFSPLFLSAQTQIELNFPSCQYLQYILALKQGTRLDTIAKGRIDERGNATFLLKEKYSTYKGVASLTVPYCNKNVNLILNSEKKIILTEVKDQPEEVIITESEENIYLKDQLSKQGELISKYMSILNGEKEQNFVLSPPELQLLDLKKEFDLFIKDLNHSPLYAARMMELLIFLSSMGETPGLSQEEIGEEQKSFILNRLNFRDLYLSGFWQMGLALWYNLNASNDRALLSSAQSILSSTEDILIRRELTNEIIKLFSKYGQDNLLMELGEEYLTIPINGKPAPELVTEGVPIQPKNCLIIFYDSDCGNCYQELHELMDKYSLLNDNHNRMEVISIAADMNKEQFEFTANKFPWKDKLCDFKGFDGDNFNNYGIVGSPTLILVDKEGIVRGRYAQLKDFLKY